MRSAGATLGALVALLGAAGCGASRHDAVTNLSSVRTGPIAATGAPVNPALTDAAALLAARKQKLGHPWFPMVPGAYVDYRVTRLGVGLRYVRVAVGAPELFFGRLATPFVYDDVPGQVRDSTLYGLHQYFSISPRGDVWFHGAQNNGFMSHTDPPVRQLLASPTPGETWADTVQFESFFPGMVLFVRDNYLYSWTLSDPAKLVLPGGVFRAVRAGASIDDAPVAGVRSPMHTEVGGLTPGNAALEAFARLGLTPLPEPLRGSWFSRHDGMVARDWPSGAGVVNLNSVTLERIGSGTGPVPPPTPPPLPPGTG